MRKYIFITHQIHNMGGAQSYIRSKMISLRNSGWDVDVLYAIRGWTAIPELSECKKCVKEIGYPTFYYTEKKRTQILEELVSLVISDEYNEIVIESTIVDNSTWGELLAERINAKHLLYSLQEDNTITNTSIQDYLKFKWQRKELAGIVPISIQQMFKSFGMIIPLERSYTLNAFQYSTVEDYHHSLTDVIEKENKDFVIGSIGRLDKPFVIPTIKSIVEYVKNNPQNKYILLLIGDSPQGNNSRQIIESICEGVSNLHLIITGYLFPIPAKLIRLCDINISTSGSAICSSRQGIPTISIDENDYLPIGILGYTTSNTLFRGLEEPVPLKECIDDVLMGEKYKKKAAVLSSPPDYSSHFEFINNSIQTKEYYDIRKLHWNKKQRVQRLLMPILGVQGYMALRSIFKRFIPH